MRMTSHRTGSDIERDKYRVEILLNEIHPMEKT